MCSSFALYLMVGTPAAAAVFRTLCLWYYSPDLAIRILSFDAYAQWADGSLMGCTALLLLICNSDKLCTLANHRAAPFVKRHHLHAVKHTEQLHCTSCRLLIEG